MEVHFRPSKKHSFLIANYNGIPAEQLVKRAALRLVEEDAEIRAGIERGIEQADRGELIDHREVVARFERLLQPKCRSAGPRKPAKILNIFASTSKKITPKRQ